MITINVCNNAHVYYTIWSFVLMHSIQVTKVTFFNVRALVFHSMVIPLMLILEYFLEKDRHANTNAKMILPLAKYQEV